MLAGRALAPAGQIVGLLMQYQGARTALESLDTLMAKPVERPSPRKVASRSSQRRELQRRDRAPQRQLRLPGRDDAALDGAELQASRRASGSR